MGRTSSKINRKFDDLLTNNTLPKCASTSIKRIKKVLKEEKLENPKNVSPKVDLETFSDSSSGVSNFSERFINDSGYFDTAPSILDDSFDDVLSTPVKHADSQRTLQEKPLTLRPLYFEVPGMGRLLRREKILETIEGFLKNSRGVVLTGVSGSGKTSVILDLVQRSFFGGNPDDSVLASSVVGYHFLIPEDPKTLDLARFLHSLAAQLSQHPALGAYKDLLQTDPNLREILTLDSLREAPQVGLERGILNPLYKLYRQDRIHMNQALILIDGLENEVGVKSNTIANFLSRNILRFPDWLKLVVTHRCDRSELTNLMHLPNVSLNMEESLRLQNDLEEFIETKMFASSRILSNISHSNPKKTNMLLAKLVQFILNQAEGSFLYANLILELIRDGFLTVRSDSFSQLPQNLDEVFHLIFSIKFPSNTTYRNIIAEVLSVVVASTKPLTLSEVYRLLETDLSFPALQEEYAKIKDVLVTRSDETLMFLSSELTSWLRKEHRFKIKPGHNLFIKYLYSQPIQRTFLVHQFVHHLVKSDLFDQKCDFVSNEDKKYLLLTFKVNRKDLKKARENIQFSGYNDLDSLNLLDMALGSSV